MLRSIGRQWSQSLRRKREATVGRICRRGFKPGTKEGESDEILKIIGINADDKRTKLPPNFLNKKIDF